MSTPDLLYSDVETELRATVRDVLTDRGLPASLVSGMDSEPAYDPALWRTLANDLGLAGLPVPEHLGGQGASFRETALVLEELGRAVAPVPFLGSAVLATSVLLHADPDAEPVAALLRRLATGEATGAVAVTFSTPPHAEFPTTVRTADGLLDGTVTTVADASVADVLVVPAATTDGPALFAVEVTAEGVDVDEVISFDLTRRVADVRLRQTPARELVRGDAAVTALTRGLCCAAGLLASEQLGVAQWCLDTTVDYVRQRHQFGRPVGSFQALKHRLADVWLDLVTARAAARYAADVLSSPEAFGPDSDVEVAVAVAQSACSTTAVHAAEEAIQLHGGIGMTWEHPAHLYLKRAKADELALGTPGRHRARLAEVVDLPPA
ncbi:acyl-CoA dehydrogenase family protein [Saccharomonospora sp. NB11]|jgi:alkylation response protein AidB-like acyl-CoA dehydrogenase|uniref:acyl-CoA dehydrogenase family protein n=1 Tax=Saccharomonospora sp. NB11 TaxID=1642298 RepID=UPI0018D1F28E|nr:acyl-CoA dehydrogenase family protein [Saccharomonospora sp. NB11]